MSDSFVTLPRSVVQRLMAQSRRSPRAYTKRLKTTSRVIPSLVLPTGALPDEPWYEPEEEPEVPLIGEAFLEYQREHSHRTAMTRYQCERSVSSFLNFARLHDNVPIWAITREAAKNWRASLMVMPVPRNGRKPNAATIDKRLKIVSHFLGWCVEREYLSDNPMRGLFLPKRLVAASKVKKAPLTDGELSKIIPALLALPTEDLPRTEFKWAALALMFTGARCMEICQVRHQDIHQEEGVWMFELKTVDEKHRVKNAPSIRSVPIHSQLIQLGFLDWVKAQPGERVFPTMFRKRSPLISMWFSRLLKSLGIKRPEVSLHSLRHTLTIKLAKARTYPPLQNRLLGHAIGKAVEERTYMPTLQFTPQELSVALEECRFPVV